MEETGRKSEGIVSRLIGWVSATLAIMAGIAVVFIATAVVVEVVARDVFDKPLMDIVTIGKMGMGVVGLLGAAYAMRVRKHVAVDLVVSLLPGRVGEAVRLVGLAIAFVCLSVLVWGTYAVARFSQLHDITYEGLYTFPVWIPQMLVPIGLGLFALELLVAIVAGAKALARGEVIAPADKHGHGGSAHKAAAK